MVLVPSVDEFVKDLRREGLEEVYSNGWKTLLADKVGPSIVLVSVHRVGRGGVAQFFSMTDDEFEALKKFVEGSRHED